MRFENNWQTYTMDDDSITKKLKVEGGYLYHHFAIREFKGVNHPISCMTFVPVENL